MNNIKSDNFLRDEEEKNGSLSQRKNEIAETKLNLIGNLMDELTKLMDSLEQYRESEIYNIPRNEDSQIRFSNYKNDVNLKKNQPKVQLDKYKSHELTSSHKKIAKGNYMSPGNNNTLIRHSLLKERNPNYVQTIYRPLKNLNYVQNLT